MPISAHENLLRWKSTLILETGPQGKALEPQVLIPAFGLASCADDHQVYGPTRWDELAVSRHSEPPGGSFDDNPFTERAFQDREVSLAATLVGSKTLPPPSR